MTIASGMRRRGATQVGTQPSGMQGSTASSSGNRVVPIIEGGTGKTTAADARNALEVPGLHTTNTFDANQTILANLSMGGGNVTGVGQVGAVNVRVNGNGDLKCTTATADQDWELPDASGTLALTTQTLAYVAKTGAYGLAATDCVVNATANSWTATLPTAVGADGKMYIIKNSGAGTITMATTSAQTIDGAAPGTIAAGSSLTVISDGANWIIV